MAAFQSSVCKNKMMKELPLEVIQSEILPRLPLKSVARFRCVSKQWNSFLSTRKFIMNKINENDVKLLQVDHDTSDCSSTTITDHSIPFKPELNVEYILASLDGLVCLVLSETSFQGYLAFWNPLTGAYKIASSDFPWIYYKYDAIGFYVDSSNDYKFLHVVEGSVLGVYIYSLRSDSWRFIKLLVEDVDFTLYKWSSATFFGQSLYFTVTEKSEIMVGHNFIIAFDVNTEIFRVIQFPPIPDTVVSNAPTRYGGSLVVLDKCIYLCGVYITMGFDLKVYVQGDMWRMDGDRWEMVEAFPRAQYTSFMRSIRPEICITRNGTWLVDLEDENCFTKMKMVDFATNYWYFDNPSLACTFRRMIYVETLVSPNMLTVIGNES